MEKFTNRKSKLDRVVAFAMAVVMVLTLVAVDSRVHLFAADNKKETIIDLSTLVNGDDKDMSLQVAYNDSDTKFNIQCSKSTDNIDKDNLYFAEFDLDDEDAVEEKLATSTDAGKKLSRLEADSIEKGFGKNGAGYAFYVLNDEGKTTEAYKLISKLTVLYDDEAPVIDNIVQETNYMEVDSEGNFIVSNNTKEESVLKIKATDSDNGSGIDKVVLVKSDGETELTKNSDGTYKFTVPSGSGSYTFKAYDKAGNESTTKKILVRQINKIEIKDVKIDYSDGLKTGEYKDNLLISTSLDKVNYILGNAQGTITVTASETMGDASTGTKDVPLTLVCTYIDLKNNSVTYTESQEFKDGVATINVPPQALTSASGKFGLRIEDKYGNKSYSFDENKDIIFVDGTAPSVSVDGIVLKRGGAEGGAISQDAYNNLENKWAQSVKLNVVAKEDNSYINKLSYSYGKVSKDINEGISYTADTNNLTYRKNELTFGEDSKTASGTKVTFSATNYVGLTGESDISLYIDNQKPSATFSYKGAGETTDKFAYQGGSVEVSIEATDALSGVDSLEVSVTRADSENGTYSKDNSVTANVNGAKASLTIKNSGYYEVTATVKDKAGNTFDKTESLYVDTTDLTPAISVKRNGDTEIKSGSITNGDKVVIEYTVEGFALTGDNVSATITRTAFDKGATAQDISSSVTKKTEAVGAGVNKVTVSYTVENNKNAQGTYDISVVASKNSDSSIKKSTTYSFAYDTLAPGIVSVKCVTGSKNETVNRDSQGIYRYKGTDTPKLQVSMEDNHSVVSYSVKNGDAELAKGKVTGSDKNSTEKASYEKIIDLSKAGLKESTEYTVAITVADEAGNEATSEVKFVIDSKAPTIQIEEYSSVSGKYFNDAVELTYNATDDFRVDRVEITGTLTKSDKKETEISQVIKNVSSGSNMEAIKEYSATGRYSLVATAYDTAGNVTSTKTLKFVVDKTKPTVTFSQDSEETAVQEKDIAFKIKDDYGINDSEIVLTFRYRQWDSEEWHTYTKKATKGTISAKLKPWGGVPTVYTNFVVTAIDKAGNKQVYKLGKTFYIDETLPEVEISPEPTDNDGYYNGSVAFDIAVSEQFNLNGKVVIEDKGGNVSKRTESFKGKDYLTNGVYDKEGKYDIVITATDAAGNVYNSKEVGDETSFVIDLTKPVVTLGNVSKLNNSNVTLPISIADNFMGKSYEVKVVRKSASGATTYNGVYDSGSWKNTSFQKNITFSEEGDYTVTVSAKDKAGNVSKEKTVSFRIDKTAPVITISGVNDTQSTSCTATIAVDEAFPFSFDGQSLAAGDINVTITKKTDGTAASNIATMSTSNFSTGNPHTVTYSFAEDGEYTITATAKDLVGNVAATVTKTFKVDANAPELTIAAVDKNSKAVNSYDSIGSQSNTDPNYVDMSIQVQEAFFATDEVNISVTKDGKDVSSSYFTNYKNSAETSTGSQRFSEDGVYNVSVSAKDQLGNAAEDYNIVFTVDNTPPTVEPSAKLAAFNQKATDGDDGTVLLNAEDFADILGSGYEALWDVNDTSVFTVDAKLDGVNLVDFSDLSDGYHKISLTVTDEVGHQSQQEFEFTYDGTAPRIIITGVEDKDVKNDPFTMTIGLENDEDEITSIVINGETIDPSLYQQTNTYEMQVEEYDKYTVEVTATDKAGNISSTYDEDTGEYFSFRLSEKVNPIVLIIIIIIILLLAALLVFVIISSRKKKKTE